MNKIDKAFRWATCLPRLASGDEALIMMRDGAEIEDCSLEDVETAVLSTDLRFDGPS